MLTIHIQPLNNDVDDLNPHSPITITLSGAYGKSQSGQLLWGLWDLTGLANALERFSRDLRTKKMIFESTEKPFQIICGRRKYSMVVVFANGQQIEALQETEAYSIFTNALIQFYTEYYDQMAQADDSASNAVSDTLILFKDLCREFTTG